MRILLVVAQPLVSHEKDPVPLGLASFIVTEVREKLVSAIEHSGIAVEVTVLPWATPENIMAHLTTRKCDLVCIYCHGTTDSYLLFEGHHGRAVKINSQNLQELLRLNREVPPAVVVMACHSRLLFEGWPASKTPIVSVLGGSGIGQVSAAAFLGAFVRSLGMGDSVASAFEDGKTSIRSSAEVAEEIPSDAARADEAGKLHLSGNMNTCFKSEGYPSIEWSVAPKGNGPLLDRAVRESFFGRKKEQFMVQEQLTQSQIVRICGELPGIGKSALAREVSNWWHERHLAPGGVFAYDASQSPSLADLHSAIDVELELASSIAIADYLVNEECLVLLDNFETVLDERDTGSDEAKDLLTYLRSYRGKTKWLLTSRRIEGLFAGEGQTIELSGLPEDEAQFLFCERVSRKNYELAQRCAGDDFDDLRRVCDFLEHVPLLLELAADTLAEKLLSPARLLDLLRSSDIAAGLTPSRLGLDERQTNYVRSLEFSYDALPPEMQRAFAALSIFTGGASRSIADAVLRDAGFAQDAIPTLASRSLLRHVLETDYFAFHPIIERYARFKATEDNILTEEELETLRKTAAGHYMVHAQVCSQKREFDSASFVAELPNIRRALAWAKDVCVGAKAAESEQLFAANVCLTLGGALWTLPIGDRGINLRDVVAACKDALEVYTREAYPADWAGTQNNLANALGDLFAVENDPQLLRDAVVAYKDALEVYTREAYPADWAMTQNNLAVALRNLFAVENDPQLLRDAVAAYKDAFEVYTREAYPAKWAVTQNNLAIALGDLFAVENDPQLLRDAVAAYKDAFEVYTREAYPAKWAGTQNNLAVALRNLFAVENDPQLLRDAVAAYKDTLEVYTREAYPAKWAGTQNNLANALGDLFAVENDPQLLRDAVAACKDTLEVYTREAYPAKWAGTQNNLAIALGDLFAVENDPQLLRDAVAAYKDAFEVYTREAYPADWAMTQNNLAVALGDLFAVENDPQLLRDAVAACKGALEVRTREAYPADWAGTQNNLAVALGDLFAVENDPQLLCDAVAACKDALVVRTREAYPADWAVTQNNLAVALELLEGLEGLEG